MSAIKQVRFRLSGAVVLLVLLLVTAALLAERFLSAPVIKEKIQQTVAAETGVQLDYRKIELSYFPSPTIELQQLSLAMPDRIQGTVAALRFSPKLLDLLVGKLHLGTVELEGPEMRFQLFEPVSAERQARSVAPAGVKETMATVVEQLRQLVPRLRLRISGGRFTVTSGTRQLAGEDLDLDLGLSVDDVHAGRATLLAGLSRLIIEDQTCKETLTGVNLKGTFRMENGETAVMLEQLSLAEPALRLDGSLTMASAAPSMALNVSGRDIDVDATRRTALALAGDMSPMREIFTYLVGGTVPQINFHSQGKTASELGELQNIHIEGQLQHGAVSIPEIELDLTEVTGEVVVADGILAGTGLSTRLEGSTGHSGRLKVGLAEGNDLFQLELMLSADLTQAQQILERIVENPTFNRELALITNLKGTGAGKLVLGDSLADIHARVEASDMHLSFEHQLVPFPININSGQVAFTKNRISFSEVIGTLGKSEFSGLDCTVNWQEALYLDVNTEHSRLSLAELYPWLSSLKDVQVYLQEFKKVSGRLDVGSATFKGAVDQPQQWQYTAAGVMNDLIISTPRFPADISLTEGEFTLDRETLTLRNTTAGGLDANLVLNGGITGFSGTSGQKIDVALDATLGPQSVAWLREAFEVPESYSIRTPVTLTGAKLSWQPGSDSVFAGGVTIADGPDLILDVTYRPEDLRVEKLMVQDHYSDADITFSSGKGGVNLSFRGRLLSESLENLFVEAKLGKGRLQGDVAVTVPEMNGNGASARGNLKGSNVVIPLVSGEELGIGQVLLEADGSRVEADMTSLTWHSFLWNPVKATVDFTKDGIRVKMAKAELCGIDSPGEVTVSGKDLRLDLTLNGKELDVGTSYSCLRQGHVKMTGTMDVSSRITATGQASELVRKMEGPLEMTFSNGVIEQDRLLSTILEVLNVTEIFRGRIPDLTSSGFAYTTLTVQGEFRDGKLLIEKLYMDGETLGILGNGEMDLEQQTVHIELLAAPFRTVDTIIKHIPGVNYLLGGSLVAIPLSVSGDLAEPRVVVMSPSSVSNSLLNLAQRTITLPFKLIQSIIPMGATEKK